MIYRLFAAAFALVMFLALSGCGSSDSSDPVVAESATIGAAGGTLDGPDGVQLIIPAGALSEPVTIRIARTSAGAPQDPPGDYTLPGAIYEFTPHDLTFEAPVTIRMPAGSVPAGATVSPFTASPGETAWRRLEAGTSDGILTFETLSFSWFTPGWCAPNTSDPQTCVNATITPQLTATPADAATLISYEHSFNHRAWSVTKAAAMKIAFELTAPEDCINSSNEARLTVKRKPSSTITAATVLDQPVALVPDLTSTLRSRQTVNWDFSLSQADNGIAVYDVLFTCVRTNGVRRSIGGYLLFKTSIPPGPQAPAITTQPSDVTVTEPVAATFTVAATGDPAPAYQWQRSSNGTSWTDIAGATAASYTTPATSAASDDGSYFRVTATNTAGTATSDPAKLAVLAQVSGSWRAPETIATTEDNLEPSVGFDGTGRALAVWSELSSTGAYRILHAARPSGGVWSAPSVLTALSFAYAPRIAVAPNGQAVVAFERNTQIQAARFDGSVWSPPVALVTQSGGSNPRNVSVAIDTSGRAIVAWYGSDGTRSRAYASVSVGGDTWTPPQALDGYDAGTPQVAVNGDGKGFVIFGERNASAQSRVTAAPVDLGASPAFGIPQPLRSFVSSTPGQMRIAVDASGNAIAVWLDTEGVSGDLVWSRFDATGGTWSTYQLLAAGVGTQVDANARPYNLALTMNAGGDAVVVWGQSGVTDGAVSEQAIFSRRMAAGGTWGSVERRSVNTPTVRDYAENPRVAISDAGRIAVTWISKPPLGTYAAWGQVFEGGSWQSAQAIMTSGNDIEVNGEHALAMDGSGIPLAIWRETSSGANPLVGTVWR